MRVSLKISIHLEVRKLMEYKRATFIFNYDCSLFFDVSLQEKEWLVGIC